MFKYNPNDIKLYKIIEKNAYSKIFLDNTIIIFKSIDNIFYLVYSINNIVIFYNLIDEKKINEIKYLDGDIITNFRHHLDELNKRDLVLTISLYSSVRIWNANDLECILNYENLLSVDYLKIFSSCFIYYNSNIYFLVSSFSVNEKFNEKIKIYDLKGNKVDEINDSNDNTYYIDCLYSKKFNENYIITGNVECVKSFGFDKKNLYKRYFDSSVKEFKDHLSIIIYINKIIESSLDGYIRIWDFHTAKLLTKIEINKQYLYGICLWNSQYLLIGCSHNEIKLVDYKDGRIVNRIKEKDNKSLKGKLSNDRAVLSLLKFVHPKYGECLISKGNKSIKLWSVQY